MAEPATLQQALVRFLDPARLDRQRQRVCSHLLGCRTEAMGGMRLQCGHCDYERSLYFSCRDRHCPQCQSRAIEHYSRPNTGGGAASHRGGPADNDDDAALKRQNLSNATVFGPGARLRSCPRWISALHRGILI